MDIFSLLAIGQLWSLTFADGSVLNGTMCTSVSTNTSGIVVYRAPNADVEIATRPLKNGVELQGKVTVRSGIVTDFMLPSRMTFSPDDVGRVAFPGDKRMGTGYSLKDGFFRPQTDIGKCAWEAVAVAGHGYKDVYGGRCAMRPIRDVPVPVTVTEEGFGFLGAHAASITNRNFVVNRAPLPGQYDRVIVDSPHGPLFSGSSLGGKGMIWRVGTASGYDGRYTRLALLRGCVRGVLRENKNSPRRRIAFLCLPSGPKNTGYCPASQEDIRTMMQKSSERSFEYVELKTPAELSKALKDDGTLIIVNPYPEAIPVARAEDFAKMLADVREYVRNGGHWLAVGGLSFYKALVPQRWHSLGGGYPGLFANIVHWKWKDGSTCSLMGVRPRPPHEPWKCPNMFVPGSMRIGADEKGGWFEHGFRAWVTNGVTWATPAVRLSTNQTFAAACDEYVRINNLSRSLESKVGDKVKLEKFKKSPLLFVSDNCAKCRRALPNIPVPSLIHQSQYLKGGFDKQYPDHLPPRSEFGTIEEYRAFISEVRAAGHLYSPYTNPTWWCDHPRGPTFKAAGDAPLSLDAKGKPLHEVYGKADGWTVCFWHPAVQEANRRTRRQFLEELPVDMLFQDQCGARRLAYDFNPASPHPTAYLEGMISMVEEDSRFVPLGTEDGWDRVAREETALCGLSWGTVPVHEGSLGQNVLAKVDLPAHLWEIEPIPVRLFHDTCLFYLHDLGGFAKNERILAWCLALGYQLSYRCNAWHFIHDKKVRAWYDRLHELQSRVVSKYAGRKLVAFRHDRTALFARKDADAASRDDDGIVEAEYEGGAKVVVNLGNAPRIAAGYRLAPYGYFISAPGVEASALEGCTPVVVEKKGK